MPTKRNVMKAKQAKKRRNRETGERHQLVV